MRRVHDALLPGGEFHLIGEMLDADRAGPLPPARWRRRCGPVGSAGFHDVQAHEFIPETLARVTGRK